MGKVAWKLHSGPPLVDDNTWESHLGLAPEEIECKLHERLDDLPGVVVFLVMGYRESEENVIVDHDSNLTWLLQRARETTRSWTNSKIKHRQPEVNFMRYVITNQNLKLDPEMVEAIKEIPRPTCKKELATLLGFMNYMSKFYHGLQR